MHKRAIVGAVTGALALTAFVAPAAQADNITSGNTKISNVVVNGGKSVVVGATAKKTVKLKFTVTDNSGVWRAAAFLYRGKNTDSMDTAAPSSGTWIKCAKVSSTKATCSASYTIQAGSNAFNEHAGTWKTWAIAQGKDADFIERENIKSFKVLRASQLASSNAAPEPVAKGATITVTSKLTRANWNSGANGAFGGQSVQLQFKAKNASSYKTVKTVKSSATGALSTTVKAGVDGNYRYVFAGTSTTAASAAGGDFIDVK